MMNKIWIAALFFLLAHGVASAQNDTQNIAKAREALVMHNCAEASKYLVQVSPASRLGAPYLLAMAKNQDCMSNPAQAMYYYNKYLALQPADDTVARRVAELSDQKSKAAKNEDNNVNVNTYKPVSRRNRKKRSKDLVDNYYYSGIGYSTGLGTNAPVRSGVAIEGGNGFLIIDDKAVLDVNSTVFIMGSGNSSWGDKATQALPPGFGAITPESAWGLCISVGFNPVLVNKRNLAVAAGPFFGVNIYTLSADFVGGAGDMTPNISPCYGVKANLYLGDHIIFFGRLQLVASNTMKISADYSGDYTVPASYSMASLGISVKLDSSW